jgi:hypothetical protein
LNHVRERAAQAIPAVLGLLRERGT